MVIISSERAKLHIFNQKYSKNSNIVKYYYNLTELFSILIYFEMQLIPAVFSASLLQSSALSMYM